MDIIDLIIFGAIALYMMRHMISVQIKPYGIAESMHRTKQSLLIIAREIKTQFLIIAQREETLARQKAQEVYDKTIGRFFTQATDEEKEVVLAVFRKYMPQQ